MTPRAIKTRAIKMRPANPSRHGRRRQSAAATALSPALASRELLRAIARTKAAWRFRFPPQSMTIRALPTTRQGAENSGPGESFDQSVVETRQYALQAVAERAVWRLQGLASARRISRA